jgi:hypothetical protein
MQRRSSSRLPGRQRLYRIAALAIPGRMTVVAFAVLCSDAVVAHLVELVDQQRLLRAR